jgi:integrase/recombinase XerD
VDLVGNEFPYLIYADENLWTAQIIFRIFNYLVGHAPHKRGIKMNEDIVKFKNYLSATNKAKTYADIMKIFVVYCTVHDIDYKIITQETIINFFNANPKFSINYKNNFRKAGKCFYEFLNLPDGVSAWTSIKYIKPEERIPDYLTEEDLENIIKYAVTNCSTLCSSVKVRALFKIMFYGALRLQELLILKRTDINLQERYIKVFGKGRRERITPFPERIVSDLEEYFSSEKEELNAFNISKWQLYYLIEQVQKHLGRRIYPHLFRHSGSRDYLGNGGDLYALSKQLGHKSMKTTEIYARPDIKQMIKTYRTIMDK